MDRIKEQIVDSDLKVHVAYKEQYGMFKLMNANRDINGAHVKKIKRSYMDIGQLKLPILVNENFEIIEGQHRFTACKEMGLPIYYMIQPGAGIKECRSLNVCSSNWKNNDFITSEANGGNENYIRLAKLQERHPDIGLGGLTTALFGWVKANSPSVRNGGLIITESYAKYADQALTWTESVMEGIKKKDFGGGGARSYLVTALILLHRYSQLYEKIDLDRIKVSVGRLDKHSDTWPDAKTCIRVIEDHYNKGLRTENKIRFHRIFEDHKGFSKGLADEIVKRGLAL